MYRTPTLTLMVCLILQMLRINCSTYKDHGYLMENCGNRIPFNYSIISRNVIQGEIDLQCAILCLDSLWCKSYVFNVTNKQCILSWQIPESCEQMEVWEDSVMCKVGPNTDVTTGC